MTIDTLKLAKNLQQHGFNQQQAEGLAAELKTATSEGLATKDDIAALKIEIANLKADVRGWMLAQTLLLIAAMVGLKLFA